MVDDKDIPLDSDNLLRALGSSAAFNASGYDTMSSNPELHFTECLTRETPEGSLTYQLPNSLVAKNILFKTNPKRSRRDRFHTTTSWEYGGEHNSVDGVLSFDCLAPKRKESEKEVEKNGDSDWGHRLLRLKDIARGSLTSPRRSQISTVTC